jgi:NAD(P)H-hydrate repair Nnr-like enzyme with NAD(P)H-hydrate epimerase domain
MEAGGFSLDQLMELAGLSVSQAGELSSNHQP